MTRNFRFRFPLVVASVAALLALGATAAAAGTTPSPSPTPVASPLHFQREAFIAHANTADPGGTVFARGPVRGIGTGNFTDPAPDQWNLTGPTGTVRVFHGRIGAPVVNFPTCTASLDQTVRWALIGRSGADRFAFGFGTARVSIREILFRTRSGICLPRVVLWQDAQVLGVGQAVNLRHHFRAPLLTPALLPVS